MEYAKILADNLQLDFNKGKKWTRSAKQKRPFFFLRPLSEAVVSGLSGSLLA